MSEKTWIEHVAGGSVTGVASLESSFLLSPKVEHSRILSPSDPISRLKKQKE